MNRATAATGMNEGSSRSHSVFTVTGSLSLFTLFITYYILFIFIDLLFYFLMVYFMKSEIVI